MKLYLNISKEELLSYFVAQMILFIHLFNPCYSFSALVTSCSFTCIHNQHSKTKQQFWRSKNHLWDFECIKRVKNCSGRPTTKLPLNKINHRLEHGHKVSRGASAVSKHLIPPMWQRAQDPSLQADLCQFLQLCMVFMIHETSENNNNNDKKRHMLSLHLFSGPFRSRFGVSLWSEGFIVAEGEVQRFRCCCWTTERNVCGVCIYLPTRFLIMTQQRVSVVCVWVWVWTLRSEYDEGATWEPVPVYVCVRVCVHV